MPRAWNGAGILQSVPAPTILKVAVIAVAQWFACGGCKNSPHEANVVVDQHGGYGEPRIALLSCGPGHVLDSEMGHHSAKVWCERAQDTRELADGGAR